jgi:hypothetical protein
MMMMVMMMMMTTTRVNSWNDGCKSRPGLLQPDSSQKIMAASPQSRKPFGFRQKMSGLSP